MDFYKELIKKYGIFFDNMNNDISFECFSFLGIINKRFKHISNSDDKMIVEERGSKYTCHVDFGGDNFIFELIPMNNNEEVGFSRKFIRYNNKQLIIREMDIVNDYYCVQDINFNVTSGNPFYSNNINYYSINDIKNPSESILNKDFDAQILYTFDSPLFNNNAEINSKLNKKLEIFKGSDKYKKGFLKCAYPIKKELNINNFLVQYSYYLGALNIINNEEFRKEMEIEGKFFSKIFKK